MNLNDKQTEAVHYISGPCLVIAGAGSGKTRVITEKIVHLINNCGYEARNVYAVTFTNKAAKEMKERISSVLDSQQIKGLKVSTFHSLGLEILKNEYSHVGKKANFTLFDEYDQQGIVKEILQRMNSESLDKDDLKEKIANIIQKISNYKNDLLSPNDVNYSKDEQFYFLIYQEYQRCLDSYNALDFDDLIFLPTILFKNNEEILSKWQKKVRYLLVDEYQDTNSSQYAFIKLLVKKHEHFTVVGDDDQSIYSWRGARPQNIPMLQKDFQNLKVIMLEQNYRSKGRILKCANILISHNPHDFVKNLYSELDYGEKIRVVEIPSSMQEGKKIVTELMAHHYIHHSNYRDYAILYRSNYQSRELEKALQESNIPYRIIGGTSFFAQSEIKDMMCYLRVLASNDDSKAFLRIINVPRRNIGSASIEHLDSFARKKDITLLDACMDQSIFDHLKRKEAENFFNFGQMIISLRQKLNSNLYKDYLKKLPEIVGYEQWLFADSSSDKSAEIRLENVKTLLTWVQQSMEGNIQDLLEPMKFNEAITKLALRELLDRNEQDYELDEVQLMTLHSSKGLEFPYVFLIGMEEGILPHKTSVEQNDVDEERRLAYVGITRAKIELICTLCLERKTREQDQLHPKPSRFLSELPQEDLAWEKKGEHVNKIDSEKEMEQIFNEFDQMFKQFIDGSK